MWGTEGSELSSDSEEMVVEATANNGDNDVVGNVTNSSGVGGDVHDPLDRQSERERDQPARDEVSELNHPPDVEPQQQPAVRVDVIDNVSDRERREQLAQPDTDETSVAQPVTVPTFAGPTPMPRRSTRHQVQPSWMTGGDYVLSQQTRPPDPNLSVESCMGAEKCPEDAIVCAMKTMQSMPDIVVKMFVRELLAESGIQL